MTGSEGVLEGRAEHSGGTGKKTMGIAGPGEAHIEKILQDGFYLPWNEINRAHPRY
jgi:hypothetical protein